MSGTVSTVPASLPEWREPAPAKINLALHVTGQRPDGYHTLSSLVAFTQHGDDLTVSPAKTDRLTLSGPYAEALGSGASDDNIVWKALLTARAVLAAEGHHLAPLALGLQKSLPVASGIGGGSADAAALLRIVEGLFPGCRSALRQAALRLGADVPMCFDGVPAMVAGLGEIATPLRRFPEVACLLVNPGIAISTPAVFRQLASRSNPAMAPVPEEGFASLADLVFYLRESRNDLAVAAIELAPPILALEQALIQASAAFARMSGSGATVFGLFESASAADAAGRAVASCYPGAWILPTRLMPALAKDALK